MRAILQKWWSLGFVLAFGTVVASGGLVVSAANAQSVTRTAANAPNATPVNTQAKANHASATAKATNPATPKRQATKSKRSHTAKNSPAKNSPPRFYVDFRARTAASYGHAFVWYGRVGDPMVDVAGLHPATDSVIPYILGHIIPVPSETGASYGDLDEEYLTASYRVTMDADQAEKVFAFIKHLQSTSPLWQAATVNCVQFISRIAQFMGLEVPATNLLFPENWVNSLHELNGKDPRVHITAAYTNR